MQVFGISSRVGGGLSQQLNHAKSPVFLWHIMYEHTIQCMQSIQNRAFCLNTLNYFNDLHYILFINLSIKTGGNIYFYPTTF